MTSVNSNINTQSQIKELITDINKCPQQLASQLPIIQEKIAALSKEFSVLNSADNQAKIREIFAKFNNAMIQDKKSCCSDLISLIESVARTSHMLSNTVEERCQKVCKEITKDSDLSEIMLLLIRENLTSPTDLEVFKNKFSKIYESQHNESQNVYKLLKNDKFQLIADSIHTMDKMRQADPSAFIQSLSKVFRNTPPEHEKILDAYQGKPGNTEICDIFTFIIEHKVMDPFLVVSFIKRVATQTHRGDWVASLCHLFGISGTPLATEIAEFILEQPEGGYYCSKGFNLLGIKEESTRIKLAKIAMGKESDAVDNLHKYKIVDHNALIEVLMIAAKKSGSHTHAWIERNIRSLDLTPPELISIAKCIFSNCKDFEKLNFYFLELAFHSIDDESERYEIAKIAFKSNPVSALTKIKWFRLDEKRSINDLIQLAVLSNPLRLMEIIKDVGSAKTLNNPLQSEMESTKELNALVKKTDPKEATEWITCFNWISVFFKWSEKQLKDYLPYAKQILLLKEPELRNELLVTLAKFGIPSHPLAANDGRAFDVMLKPFLQDGLKENEYSSIMQTLNHETYKNSVKKEIVLKSLYSLHNCTSLNAAEKIALLKNIFLDKTPTPSQAHVKEQESKSSKITKINIALQALEVIIMSDRTSLIKIPLEANVKSEMNVKTAHAGTASFIDWSDILNQIFNEMITIGQLKDFDIKYSHTIGQARNKMALLIYAGKLNSLPRHEKEISIKSLKDFVTSILEGSYASQRYQRPAGSHLETVFKGREDLLQEWQKGNIEDFEKLVKSSQEAASSPVEDPIDYLHFNFVQHSHLDLTLYPTLKSCLERTKKCSKALAELSDELKVFAQTKSASPTKKFEEKLIKLLDPDKTIAQKQSAIAPFLAALEGMKKSHSDAYPFLMHIKDMLQQNMNTQAHSNLVVIDTDNWEDLLLCGTEVAASCQNVSGNTANNKCLLGYLSDGKNRMIVVKNKDGKEILARCIMRLLWDDKLKQPVLFQERFYNALGAPKDAQKAIDAMFIKRAKALGVALVRAYDPRAKEPLAGLSEYPNTLASIGSPAPFEYVDAGSIKVTKGRYFIPPAHFRQVNI